MEKSKIEMDEIGWEKPICSNKNKKYGKIIVALHSQQK
jgi:hypothetical protein